jgi:cytochrome d ubiquinol oxidase subunit II
MLLLFCLIFRAVSIEFRSKQPMAWWRTMWDWGFAISSVVAALLIGVAMGNIAWGIPLDSAHEFAGTFFGLLHPYALLVGVTTVSLFLMHGSIYLVMKTEGRLHDQVRGWIRPTMIGFILCYVITTMATLLYVPQMTEHFKASPGLFLLPALNVLAVANIPREIDAGRDFRAFLSSCVSVLLLLAIFGVGLYPDLIVSTPDPAHTLTIYNGCSSDRTLRIMRTIALIGMPLVVGYTASIYWVFRGKVKLDANSY